MKSTELVDAVTKFQEIAKIKYEGAKAIVVIPELKIKDCGDYVVGTFNHVMSPIIDKHDVIIVAGDFFGDEGKGKTIDALANDPRIKLIIRPHSGENAGHTVWKDGVKYIFHLVPSGVLEPGKKNLVGSECVMDPINFMKELEQLTHDQYKDKLFVDNSVIVTPYHKLMDFIQSPANSSTLRGISPSHAAKVKKVDLRLDDLLMPEEYQKQKFKKDMRDYEGLMHTLGMDEDKLLKLCEKTNAERKEADSGADDFGVIPEHVINFLKAENKTDYLINLYKENVVENELFPTRIKQEDLIQETLDAGDKVLIEAAQSYFLSNRIKHHHGSSTSADTTAVGTAATADYNMFVYNSCAVGVLKFESSRVGRGENPTGYVNQTFFSDLGVITLNDLDGICDDFEGVHKQFTESIGENGILEPTMYKDKDGKEYPIGVAMAIASSKHFRERGATTKKPRITGLIDCVHQAHVNKKQGPYVSISAMDRGDDLETVGMTIAYAIYAPDEYGEEILGKFGYKNGDIIKAGDTLPMEKVQKYCIPIINTMKGWKGNPIAADKRKADDPLPREVQDFVGAFEHYTSTEKIPAQVVSIGNGQDTKNLIYIKKAA